LFRPKRFEELERLENEAINAAGKADNEPSGSIVREAFYVSLVLVLLFGAFGYGVGAVLRIYIGAPHTGLIGWLQISGVGLLLWGTLFVRGWEIATFGVTLPERVKSVAIQTSLLPRFSRSSSCPLPGGFDLTPNESMKRTRLPVTFFAYSKESPAAARRLSWC